MRRIAISTPNVMVALRRLRRETGATVQLRPISGTGESDGQSGHTYWHRSKKIPHTGRRCRTLTFTMEHPHSGQSDTAVLVQTFEMVFQQYHRHPESKSFAPAGTPCKADSAGLLKRYPVTATGFH